MATKLDQFTSPSWSDGDTRSQFRSDVTRDDRGYAVESRIVDPDTGRARTPTVEHHVDTLDEARQQAQDDAAAMAPGQDLQSGRRDFSDDEGALIIGDAGDESADGSAGLPPAPEDRSGSDVGIDAGEAAKSFLKSGATAIGFAMLGGALLASGMWVPALVLFGGGLLSSTISAASRRGIEAADADHNLNDTTDYQSRAQRAAFADVFSFGLTDVYSGATGKGLVSDRPMSPKERGQLLGGGAGNFLGFVLGKPASKAGGWLADRTPTISSQGRMDAAMAELENEQRDPAGRAGEPAASLPEDDLVGRLVVEKLTQEAAQKQFEALIETKLREGDTAEFHIKIEGIQFTHVRVYTLPGGKLVITTGGFFKTTAVSMIAGRGRSVAQARTAAAVAVARKLNMKEVVEVGHTFTNTKLRDAQLASGNYTHGSVEKPGAEFGAIIGNVKVTAVNPNGTH